MVIITGLGRCGTSILTKYLGMVGFALGRNVNWNEEARAGMELSTAYSITDNMHHYFLKNGDPIDLNSKCHGDYWNMTYREAILNVDKDERQGKVDIFKDPRITWHPDLLRAWWSVRHFQLIICHRKPEDVYKSRKALSPRYDDPKRRELIEYKIDFEEFFTTVLELGIQYKTLYFPNFLFNYNMVWNTLDSMGLKHNYDKGKEVWDDIIELKKYE